MKTTSFIIHCIAILLFGIITGTLLLIGIYSIPGNLIHNKVSASLDMLIEQDKYPYIIPGYEPSKLDNFSEFIMLEMAYYTYYDTAIENAMLNPYHESNEPMDALRSCLNNEQLQVENYSRYWHGYLLYLKPLLLFFSIGTIRLITASLQLLLIFLIVIKLSNMRALLPFLCLLIGICFPTVFTSLQYTSCSMIALLSSYVVLKKRFCGKDYKIGLFMLITGMATSFFDFLTFPLITLMLPISMWLLINGNDFSIKVLLLSLLTWGVGYGGMWAGKWLMGTLLTHHNLITDVMQQFRLRISSTDVYGTSIPLTSGLIYCTRMMLTPVVVFFSLVSIVYGLTSLIHRNTFHRYIKVRIALFILLLLPVIWMLVTCNHSLVHKAYTYRTMASTIFPFLLSLSPLDFHNS